MALSIPSVDTSSWDYYDVMAALCSLIDSKDQCCKQSIYRNLLSNLKKFRVLALEQFSHIIPPITSDHVTYTSLNTSGIHDLLQFCTSEEIDDLSLVTALICILDERLHLGKNFSHFIKGKNSPIISDRYEAVSNYIFQFEALNMHTKEHMGLLLPNIFCEWEKTSTRTRISVSLDPLSFALHNYFWCKIETDWHVVNFYTDFWGTKFDKIQISKTAPLKIVSSPLSNCAPYVVDFDDTNNVFLINYTSDLDEQLNYRMKKILDYASAQKADIVMFPEMMGTPGCIQYCKDYLSDCLSDLTRHKPKLYFLPTTEQLSNGQWTNTLNILDQDGECIFQYHKQHPFIYDKKVVSESGTILRSYSEPIAPDKNICIFHIPGIGRLGIIICADIFFSQYMTQLFDNLQISFLLHPISSGGRDLMERLSAESLKYSCDILQCNTCASWDNAELPFNERTCNINFSKTFINIYYPCGHRASSDSHNPHTLSLYAVNPVSCSGFQCQGCLFVTEIPKNYSCTLYSSTQIRLEEILDE